MQEEITLLNKRYERMRGIGHFVITNLLWLFMKRQRLAAGLFGQMKDVVGVIDSVTKTCYAEMSSPF